MTGQTYLDVALEAVKKVQDTQQDGISKAAGLMAEAIKEGRSIFSFGASHSFILTEEMVYRTGGLMLVNPIYPHGMNLFIRPITVTSRLERVPDLGKELLSSAPVKEGDILIIASTSGRNAVAIDMTIAAKEKGLKVIGITSIAYSEGVTSRHPSGKKVKDFCDVVIDNCAPYGDSAVELAGFPQKVGPLSSLTGIAIVNSLVVETVRLLLESGIEPPVFMSANLDGGDEYNARLLEENRARIHYLE